MDGLTCISAAFFLRFFLKPKKGVKEETQDVLFYAYAVPGIDRAFLKEGLMIAADALVQFGGGDAEFLEIF